LVSELLSSPSIRKPEGFENGVCCCSEVQVRGGTYRFGWDRKSCVLSFCPLKPQLSVLYDAVYRKISLLECDVTQSRGRDRHFEGLSNRHHSCEMLDVPPIRTLAIHSKSCEMLDVPPIRTLAIHIKASLLFFNVYLNLDSWNYFIRSRHEAVLFSFCLLTCVECFDSSFVLTSHLEQLSCI